MFCEQTWVRVVCVGGWGGKQGTQWGRNGSKKQRLEEDL